LGGPGSGKSAVLARLGSELAQRGVALLALKADLIPASVDSLARLDDYLGLPRSIAECFRQLAAGRAVVLLIDQVDALTELMDRNPARLSVVLGLIHPLHGIDNVHIVLSCRDFGSGLGKAAGRAGVVCH
jgi:Mrp family chromosome partitioning ATPase